MFLLRALGKCFAFVWQVLSLFRLAIANVLTLAAILALIVWVGSLFSTSSVQSNSVLVLNLSGSVVEQKPALPLMASALSSPSEEDTDLHELIATIEFAAKDRAISGILLQLDELKKVGLSSSREIGAALNRFKQSGKKVWAWGTNFNQAQYTLATYASELFLHPMGEIGIKGLGTNRLYYGEALKNLGVNIHVFKAGAYKSFPESFLLKAPSPEALEAERSWLFNAWNCVTNELETARGLMPGDINTYINELPQRVRHAQGDMAQTALNANLADGVKTYDEMKAYIESQLAKNKAKVHFIKYADYYCPLESMATAPSVAVIVAEGEIQNGLSENGIIGSTTLNQQIQQALDDRMVKAIVLRVNSPGGSAVASELIRRSLELAKKAGKPVVVSMGDTAASGGYWLSMGATKVFASPTTITGSIGVFGISPTFEKSLDRLDLGQGGVGTTWLANSASPTKALDPRLGEILTLNVEKTYNHFLKVVSNARNLSTNAVNKVAQGRVWTGSQALQYGLIDRLGGIHEATAEAKKLAGLPVNAPSVFVAQSELSLSRLLKNKLQFFVNPLGWIEVPTPIHQDIQRTLRMLGNEKEILAHSLCELNN